MKPAAIWEGEPAVSQDSSELVPEINITSSRHAGLLIDLHPPRRRMLVYLIKLRAGTSTSMIQSPVWETAGWDWPIQFAL